MKCMNIRSLWVEYLFAVPVDTVTCYAGDQNMALSIHPKILSNRSSDRIGRFGNFYGLKRSNQAIRVVESVLVGHHRNSYFAKFTQS